MSGPGRRRDHDCDREDTAPACLGAGPLSQRPRTRWGYFLVTVMAGLVIFWLALSR